MQSFPAACGSLIGQTTVEPWPTGKLADRYRVKQAAAGMYTLILNYLRQRSNEFDQIPGGRHSTCSLRMSLAAAPKPVPYA